MPSFFTFKKWISYSLRYSIPCNYTTNVREMSEQLGWLNIAVCV